MLDEKIIEGIRDKNPQAFHAVFDKFYGQLTTFATSILNDPIAAEDVVSEAFVKLWKLDKDFTSVRHVKDFLYTIIKNSCVDVLRKTRTRTKIENNVVRSLELTENDIEKKYMVSEIIEKLYERINQLPERTRKVFVLTYLEGYSRSEVAQLMNLSENTVRNMNLNGMNALKAALNAEKVVVIIFLAVLTLSLL